MHFLWIDPTGGNATLPDDSKDNLGSWRRGEHSHIQRLWTLNEILKMCLTTKRPEVAQAIRDSNFPSMQADISRLFVLYTIGGYWIDLKLRLLQPFLDCLAENDLVLTEHFAKPDLPDPTGHISNSFIGASPGHPVIGRALEMVSANVARRMGGSIYHVTGATNLMNAVAEAGDLPRYRLLAHKEAWDGFFNICGGSYNTAGMHWTQREGRGENPYRN